MMRTRTTLLAASVSIIALGASVGHAQTTPIAQVAANDPAPQLDDIVVVGEKHEAPIQSTPLAITAIPGAVLAERNINQLNDLNGYVPGLSIAKSEGAERIITIRGIGYETSTNPNSQPGVAFHIDGVYIAHVMALNQDLLDVDHIEVLRGPQGTVFGENSTGGAINVITNKPVLGRFSGTGSVSYGNYNYVKTADTINIPVSDTIAVRGSIQYLRHDGYGYSVAVPGVAKYPLDNASNLDGRAALLWKPNNGFKLLMEYQHWDTNRNASLQKDITDPNPNARVVTQDYPGKFRMHTDMVYLTLSQQLGDIASLKSVTAYQWLNKFQTGDNDRLASSAYYDNLVLWQDKSRTFTQEVDLSSLGNQKVDWIVGGFYLRQKALQNILELTNTSVKFQTDSPYQHTSLAGFGQVTVHATNDFSIIAGLRYNYDKVSAQPVQYFTVIPPRSSTSTALTGKLSAEYRITPSNMVYAIGSRGYKPTGVSFVSGEPFALGSYSSGPEFVPASFKKETVWAAEVGTKNDFFDKKVRLNLAGYYYWYKNFQYTAEDPVPFAGGTGNIPHAVVYGLEAEGSVLPFAGFRLDGNISLGKGHFDSHYLTIDAQTAAQVRASTFAALGYPASYYYTPAIEQAVSAARQDVNGKRLPKMPGVQAEVSASYSWALGNGRVSLRGDMIYRGSFNYRLFAVTALDRVPAYTVFNAFISYEPDNKPWSVSFSAENLTDNLGVNSKFSDPYGSGTTSLEFIDPRQVFGTFNIKF